jgi:glycosyltransferase involved in cell wall biosynthesis
MSKLPDTCLARLLIIGNGAAKYRNMLQERARQMGVAHRIDWVGYQANPFAIMTRCDLFVSAPRWEGSSNALLEALALGMPLVATDCPTGNREVLEKGPFGTLARPQDAASLASAIETEWTVRRDRDMQRQGASYWAIGRCMGNMVALLAE